jgi:hypothetical protein
MSTATTIAVLATMSTIIVAVVGLQTFWISRSLDRLETLLDSFRAEVHADMATHTSAITDLRERVARIESELG